MASIQHTKYKIISYLIYLHGASAKQKKTTKPTAEAERPLLGKLTCISYQNIRAEKTCGSYNQKLASSLHHLCKNPIFHNTQKW